MTAFQPGWPCVPALSDPPSVTDRLSDPTADDLLPQILALTPRGPAWGTDEAGDGTGASPLMRLVWKAIAGWSAASYSVDFTLALQALPQKLGESCMLAVYRIIQEATVNALRHSDTRRIDVAVQADARKLSLDVCDHGRGLPADWKKPGHFGIRGMCERARMLGGEAVVENVPGGGVRVRATLPLD